MSNVTVNSVNNLISSESLAFIRALRLKVNATQLKPNTRMYAFFDGVLVNRYFTQTGKVLGEDLITDDNGELEATFDIPGMTFTAGEKTILFSQYSSASTNTTLGAADVYATTKFHSAGLLQRWQTTTTTTNHVIIEQVVRIEVPVTSFSQAANRDPLAQSFFTYGVTGGCFVTSIDLFFQTKDATEPVLVEIRELVGGYPTNTLTDNNSFVAVMAADVNISDDALTPTTFKFNRLVYLEAEKDYCFVVSSRSNGYNLWTSKLGEKSNETGKTVFSQPYSGSLFKSENNITWTAEQNEDIKFVMRIAEFDTNVIANVELTTNANNLTMASSSFATFDTSSYVYVNFPVKHTLDTNSKIAIACDTAGTYNGIPGTLLNGSHTVFDIKSEYVVGFIVVGAAANATGTIATGGRIGDIQIDNSGSNYSTVTPPTITITGSGTGAAAIAVIEDGKITDIVVTNPGTGYYTMPTVTITAPIGSGATATALIDPRFTVSINRIYHSINPAIANFIPAGTSVTASLDTTLAAFIGGANSNYDSGKTYDVNINKINSFDDHLLLASRTNEFANMANQSSCKLNVQLSSSNPNISPVIDVKNPKLIFAANSINNQEGETITSTDQSGRVLSIVLDSSGAGYLVTPDVLIYGTGTGATAHCTMVGGAITEIILDTPGSGYFAAPKVSFIGGSPTTAATAHTTINEYNSELTPLAGHALSRYMTKTQTLANVSSGVELFATAYSNVNSSFEVYIKTSLTTTGQAHDDESWQQLNCSIDRNKSVAAGQFLEYKFTLDDMIDFDKFSLKFVLRTQTPWDPPIIENYRTIVLAV